MPSQADFIRGLHRRFIKAWERLSGIRSFKLRDCKPLLFFRLLVHIAASIESCQTISKFTRKLDTYLIFMVLLQSVFQFYYEKVHAFAVIKTGYAQFFRFFARYVVYFYAVVLDLQFLGMQCYIWRWMDAYYLQEKGFMVLKVCLRTQ